MTRNEIAAEYTLTDRGTIASPGKFEGEPWYAVALWDLVLDGGSDFETGEDPSVSWFRVDSNLTDLLVSETMSAADAGETVGAFVDRYPVGSYVGLYEDSQGFVRLTSSAEDPSVAAESGYTDCACRDCFDVAISSDVKKPALCSDCADAACSADGSDECQRADAYDSASAADESGEV